MEGVRGDKRRYIRLDTAFPVEFQFVDENKEPISPVIKGFTRDVGKGGMCIEARTIRSKEEFSFIPGKTKLKLIINIPSSVLVTESYGTVSWCQEMMEYALNVHIFGVEYDETETRNQRLIYLYILWLHHRPKLIFVFFFALLIMAAIIAYLGLRPS